MPAHKEDKVKSSAFVIGVLLIVLGVIALVYQGISYVSREKVAQVGPITVEANKREAIPLPPVLGGIALVGGVVLVATASRKS